MAYAADPDGLPRACRAVDSGDRRVVDPMPWLVIDFLAGWAVVAWLVVLETAPEAITRTAASMVPVSIVSGTVASDTPTVRLVPKRRAEFDLAAIVAEPVVVNTPELPPHPRPLAVRIAGFGLAFLGFAAAAALVPGGLALDREPLSRTHLIELAAFNGAIAGAIGYRIAALASPNRFDRIVRIVAIGQYALPVAVATAVLRSLALPRLFIPALLALLVYAETGVRESPEPVPLNAKLRQELALLGLAAAAAIAWGMVIR